MYKETVFGGRYFTVKRTNKDGVDALLINVSDVVEMIKEICISNVPRIEELRSHKNNSNWNKAMEEVSLYLVDTIVNLDILMDIKFNINFDLVDWERDFDYNNTLILNTNSSVLKLSVKKHGWNSSFIKHFIRIYNQKLENENKDK